MKNVTVKLTAYNMGGNATEGDFDAWVAYVDSIMGDGRERGEASDTSGVGGDVVVSVESFPFSGGPSADVVSVEPSLGWDERDTIQASVEEALHALWDRWCSEGAPAVQP